MQDWKYRENAMDILHRSIKKEVIILKPFENKINTLRISQTTVYLKQAVQ